MYLICDFGITKLANKIKKQAWDKSRTDLGLMSYRRGFSPDKLRSTNLLGTDKSGNAVWRGYAKYRKRNEIGLPKLTRKSRSNDVYTPRTTIKKEMIPDSKKYTDLRKVNDYALSDSGYMGYKNTPNSFFEEAIPMKDMIETGKKIKVKKLRRY